MTARKFPLKPRGHQQDRPSKDKLLALLSAHGPQTVAALAKLTGLRTRCARGHLEQMRTYGEAFRVPGTSPILWSHQPVDGADQAEQIQDEEALAPVRVIRPAGTWERQFSAPIGAAASVFHMGGV